ncbi:sensor histidine kinase [Magnetospirillum molischianum]|uniref:histidine kinase n=1 Tax=Magnetospirillum molischianum DSM 120 TaxID=1150626 RepID=H8FV55_MAGML|nr:ATP-binding protein [Magnetospirillum molischianum]CCG42243.1 Putative two-component sensor histidine kinase, hybrid system [Magnetospirillum molischianum DSM 120]
MRARPRILVVDDQLDNCLVLEDLLSGSYEVEIVSDGLAALTVMERASLPDLVLLDVVMPGLDGFEVCRRLREQPTTRDLPLIFLSGLESTRAEERGLSLGADDFIHKPFVAPLVLARVRNVIGRRESAIRERQIAVIEARLAEQESNAAAMQAVIDRLTVMNTELERYAFVAAHDLREPLRSVTSFAQLLERHLGDELDQTGRDYLRFVVDGARRMHDLIGGLLAYSYISSNVGPPTWVSSDAACRAAIENLDLIIRESRAEIVIADLPMVRADELPLLQLFQNLIGNAVKFRSAGRPLRVEISARRGVGEWEFSVADNGIGFDPAEQDVFELFRRVRPHDGPGGSGVGLAICKRIVQTLGGRIAVESRSGKGSVFTFTLPSPEQPE